MSMIRPQLLVIATSKDSHTEAVLDKLAPSVHYFRLNVDEFPRETRLLVEYDARSWPTILACAPPSSIDLTAVTAVWFRRIGGPGVDTRVTNPAHRTFALGEAEAYVAGLCHLFGHCRWVSSYDATRRAASKLHQLHLAALSGLRVPRTVVTNDPESAIQFAAGRKSVYKTLSSPSIVYPNQRSLIFTHVLTSEDRSLLKSLTSAPILLQEYVEKSHELRITFTGNAFWTVRVDSQHCDSARVDWRAGMGEVDYSPDTLPTSVESSLRQLMQRLGLDFGAIDMIVTPGGEHVFLEVNPHGAWLWLEHATHLPISQGLADYLSGCVGNGA